MRSCAHPQHEPPPRTQACVKRLQRLLQHSQQEVVEERNLRLALESELDLIRNPRHRRALADLYR